MSDSGSLISDDPEGYRVPIHQSLTLHHLMLGIPRTLCLVIWTFCVALSLPLRTWYAIPLALFLHLVSMAAAKRDPQFWDVFKRALHYKTFYRV
jgi:type IV secretory pathway TrbD component